MSAGGAKTWHDGAMIGGGGFSGFAADRLFVQIYSVLVWFFWLVGLRRTNLRVQSS